MVPSNHVMKISLGLPLWKEPSYLVYQVDDQWLRFHPKDELENATGGTALGGRHMESFLEGVWRAVDEIQLTMFHRKPDEKTYTFEAGDAIQCNPPFFLLGLAFGLGQWQDLQKQLIDFPRQIRMGVFCYTAHWYLQHNHEGKITLRDKKRSRS